MNYIAVEELMLYESNDGRLFHPGAFQPPPPGSRLLPPSSPFNSSYPPQAPSPSQTSPSSPAPPPEVPLHDFLIQQLIAELPNCFHLGFDQTGAGGGGGVYGSSTSYWSSPATASTYDQRSIYEARCRGGQLLSFLLDYARSSTLAVKHLLQLELHTRLLT